MAKHKKRTIQIPTDAAEVSITDMAEDLGVSKQRAQQIEVAALEKFRRRAKAAKLHEFVKP